MQQRPLDAPEYLAAWVHEQLAEDPAYAELGIGVKVTPGTLVLTGAVATPERRDEIGRAVAAMVDGYDVRNDLTVPNCVEPDQPELLP